MSDRQVKEKRRATVSVPKEIVSSLCASLIKRRAEVYFKMRKNRMDIGRLAEEQKGHKVELAALHQLIAELENKMRKSP